MKKTVLLIGSLILAVFLTACGGSDDSNNMNNTTENTTSNTEQTNEEVNENQTTNSEDESESSSNDETGTEEEMQAKMGELDYKEIEVEVDYGDNSEYEIKIEQNDNDTIEAQIEDDINDEYLKGTDAFNPLYPMVKELSINQDTSKDDAIEDVLSTFNLYEDYDEFELEITFNDDTQLEYEDE